MRPRGFSEPKTQSGPYSNEGEESVKRTVWKGRPKRVTAPYLKMHSSFLVAPKYRGTRETLRESAGTIR